MTAVRDRKNGWFAGLFQRKVDFYDLLDRQARKTLEGIEALHDWIKDGTPDRCQIVRDLENEADGLKMLLERKLVESFITPFDREDIYDLSARMDEIINGAKSTVREIEALEVTSDGTAMTEMSSILLEGTRCIALAFRSLETDPKEAAEQATLARKSENRFTKVYRSAMRQLFQDDDFKRVMKTREVYRSLTVIAEKIDVVGEKLAHVIVKIS